MGRANFNDVTDRRKNIEVLDNIFCKDCKTPVFANTENFNKAEDKCPKCDRDFTKTVKKAKELQAQLGEAHNKNKNYVPPEKYI